MLRITVVLLWKHVFEDRQLLIVVGIQATEHIVILMTSLLQIKSQFAFSQLNAFNVKLQQQEVFN